jgi:putative transposase
MYRTEFLQEKIVFHRWQILSILKQAEAGTPVPELCGEHGMSRATFYKWLAKYGGRGCLPDGRAQGVGGGKPAAEEDVRRGAAEGRGHPGRDGKKAVMPSSHREMGITAALQMWADNCGMRLDYIQPDNPRQNACMATTEWSA